MLLYVGMTAYKSFRSADRFLDDCMQQAIKQRQSTKSDVGSERFEGVQNEFNSFLTALNGSKICLTLLNLKLICSRLFFVFQIFVWNFKLIQINQFQFLHLALSRQIQQLKTFKSSFFWNLSTLFYFIRKVVTKLSSPSTTKPFRPRSKIASNHTFTL